MGRLLGIDFGDRRIGLALSDPTRTIATPHSVLLRKELAADVAALVALMKEEAVEGLVVGAPMNDDGTRSAMVGRVEAFVQVLVEAHPLPVFWVDEAYTSIEADEMLRVSIKDWRVRREKVDMVAAQLILKAFLEGDDPSPRKSD